ncbi:unnamed protein product [Cunninghamella echinulata]
MFSRLDNMIQHTATHTNREKKRVYNKKQQHNDNHPKPVNNVNKKIKLPPKSLAPLVSSSCPYLTSNKNNNKVEKSGLSNNNNNNQHIVLPITPSESDFNLSPTCHPSLPHINEICHYQEPPYYPYSYDYSVPSPTHSHYLPSPKEFDFKNHPLASPPPHSSSSYHSYQQQLQQQQQQQQQLQQPLYQQNEENNSIHSSSDDWSFYSDSSSSIHHHQQSYTYSQRGHTTTATINPPSSPPRIQITADEFEALQGIFQLKSNVSSPSSSFSSFSSSSSPSSSYSSNKDSPSSSPTSLYFYSMEYDKNNNNSSQVNSFRQHFELAQESSSRLTPRSM